MTKYRSKDIFDAVQWSGNWDEVYLWCPDAREDKGSALRLGKDLANIGDWIVKRPDGTFFICKFADFKKNYEKVIQESTLTL